VAKLIYSALTSLDHYVADEKGNFDWAAPDAEVHTFVNDLMRPVGTATVLNTCATGRFPDGVGHPTVWGVATAVAVAAMATIGR
jgi:hypothetical protein